MSWHPLYFEKKLFTSNYLLVFSSFVSTPLLKLIVILLFIFFHLLIFHYPWRCFNVFLVLTKLRSFPNQIFHQFEFLLRMFKFEIVCQIDIPLKSGPNNNHNGLKDQKTFETLNRSSFLFIF
jgi:hypothetical protein